MRVMKYTLDGQGRSDRAEDAIKAGRMPFSLLKEELKKVYVKVPDWRSEVSPCEWHHCGAYGRKTDFYDREEVEDWLKAQGIKRKYRKPRLTLNWVKTSAKAREELGYGEPIIFSSPYIFADELKELKVQHLGQVIGRKGAERFLKKRNWSIE